MAGSYLLDTNVAIAFLNGESAVVTRVLVEPVTLCAIVAAELLYGAACSSRAAENTRRCQKFLDTFEVLPLTRATAEHAALVKADLRTRGRPIPENDLWIAAVALEYSLSVATRNEYIRSVSDLSVVRW